MWLPLTVGRLHRPSRLHRGFTADSPRIHCGFTADGEGLGILQFYDGPTPERMTTHTCNTQLRRRLAAVLPFTLTAIVACGGAGETPTAPPPSTPEAPARLVVASVLPATISTLLVQVSGPGISTPVTANLIVGATGIASGTLSVPAGGGRRIEVTAVDTAGVTSHRADTTVRLVAGDNPQLTLTLIPIGANAPVQVRFATINIAITGGPTALEAGDTASLAATATLTPIGPIAADSLTWASSDPSVLTVTGRRLGAVRAGTATVSVSWRGVSATRPITVTAAGTVEGDFLIEQIVTGGERLLRFATGGSEQIVVGTASGQGDLSADKTRLVFWRPFDNRLFRAAGDGSGETVLTAGAINYGPRWSADGGRVVFTREYGAGEASREIAIIGADGAGLTRLTTNGTVDEDPHLSPDGTRIVFVSQRDGNRELYVMNVDGSNQVRLTTSATVEGSPSWSPDGARIAYTSNASGSEEAWAMNADGTGAVRLTSASGTANQLVRWSPDGRRVAYRRTVSGVGEIWTVRVTGLDARRLRSVGAGGTAEYVRTWRAR